MSADYCRATNRILSKRAERDLNAFPLAQCCNSWMLGNKFQTSFPSLHSRGCFILKRMKNRRQSDLCSEQGHSLTSHTSAYARTDMRARSSRHWKLVFCHIINAMETVRQLSELLAHQPVQIWQSLGWFAATAGAAMALSFPESFWKTYSLEMAKPSLFLMYSQLPDYFPGSSGSQCKIQ